MKLFLIVNSKSISQKRHQRLVKPLSDQKIYEITSCFTEEKGHAIELAYWAVTEKHDVVVSVGGDGTLNEVVNGMMRAKKEGYELPYITILPLGTGNDFARSNRISKHLSGLKDRLENLNTKSYDVGVITLQSGGRYYFINSASIGFSADVVANMGNFKKLGALSYVIASLNTILRFKKSRIVFDQGATQFDKTIFMMTFSKGAFIGGGLKIPKDASYFNSTLSCTVIGDFPIFHFLFHLVKLSFGQPLKHKAVSYIHSEEIRFPKPEVIPYIEADGEIIDASPVKITCLPSQINFLTP